MTAIDWKTIKALDVATHPEKTRYAMTGINVCARGMTATDGKILVHRAWADGEISAPLADRLGREGRVILAKDMPKVKRGRSTFLNVDALPEAPVVEGHFPPWQDVLPAQTSHKLTECSPAAWNTLAEFASAVGEGAWLIRLGKDGNTLRAIRRENGLRLSAEQGLEHREDPCEPSGWNTAILSQVNTILETAELGPSFFAMPSDGRGALLLEANRGARWRIVAMPVHVAEDVKALLAA